MNETLFFFPHYLFTGPLLYAWLVLGLVILGLLYWRHGKSPETWNFVPFYIAVALIIHFVLPVLEVKGINPAAPDGPQVPLGIAVRGYGFFMLLGMLSGVGFTVWRGIRIGIQPEQVISLAFWMIVGGIVGARLFYVIQKRDDFSGLEPGELLVSILDMTKGGLVVYGSVFGAVIAATIFIGRARLSYLKVADLVAPGMAIGLAFGRIGCLMNGCCFGGVCDADLPAIRFPVGSPPYMQQLVEGPLLGFRSGPSGHDEYPLRISHVDPDSWAEKVGLQTGDLFDIGIPDRLALRAVKNDEADIDADGVLYTERLGAIRIAASGLPERSRPVHPTQVYSAINAALLFLFLWFYYPFRKSRGEVFALMLVFYSIARFLLEAIRTDEAGQFGTALTISQWISFAMLGLGLAMFFYCRARFPTGSRRSNLPRAA